MGALQGRRPGARVAVAQRARELINAIARSVQAAVCGRDAVPIALPANDLSAEALLRRASLPLRWVTTRA